MDLLSVVPATVAGYYALDLASHPKSRFYKKFPSIGAKIGSRRLEIAPEIRLVSAKRTIHLHHWFNFSLILLASVFITSAILDSQLTRGFLVGGILQGLKFPDRHLIKKN